jgi:hypothetical protein
MTSAITPNLIELSPERSSQIGAIGYDEEMLFVQFRRGGLYAYDTVTREEWEALLHAPSIGQTFAKTIKGVKPYKKLDAAPATAKAEVESKTSMKVVTMPAIQPEKETNDLARAAREWTEKAASILISDVQTHGLAQNMLLQIDEVRRRIVATWKPMKEAAFKAHRAVCDKEKELLAPLEAADKQLRSRIGAYTYQQMLLAQQEDERRRKQAEAEARQRAIQETEENALAAAEELYAMGDAEAAEAVLENPMPAEIRYNAPMPVRAAVAAVDGVGAQIAYNVDIVDLNAIPREYLVIDISKTRTEIARRVKQAGGRLQVPGCAIRETFATRRVGGRR